mgnify:CR=1 FL=1
MHRLCVFVLVSVSAPVVMAAYAAILGLIAAGLLLRRSQLREVDRKSTPLNSSH